MISNNTNCFYIFCKIPETYAISIKAPQLTCKQYNFLIELQKSHTTLPVTVGKRQQVSVQRAMAVFSGGVRERRAGPLLRRDADQGLALPARALLAGPLELDTGWCVCGPLEPLLGK